jgi:hypothetical protein
MRKSYFTKADEKLKTFRVIYPFHDLSYQSHPRKSSECVSPSPLIKIISDPKPFECHIFDTHIRIFFSKKEKMHKVS